MAVYRVYINILGNAGKALNGMLTDVAGLNKGLTGAVSKFGALGKAAAVAIKAAGQAARGWAKLNASYHFLGPKLLERGANFLTGPQMEAGIALLQRRQQAMRGFGPKYARAQQQADLLAASYGLNPADVISSLNVLTGMRVGAKRLSIGQASRLVQAGGLISQQGGVSYENVMLNLQQLMAQDQLHSRDIKQLLTHAPILGRYAIDEMERKSITGMTAQDYFKADKSALLNVLERYLEETPAILSTRARGIAQQAQVGFYAKLAANPSWLAMADKYAQLMSVTGEALSKLFTSAVESEALRTSVNAFITLIDRVPELLDKATPAIDKWVKGLYKRFGLSYDESKGQTLAMGEQERWVETSILQNIGAFRTLLSEAGHIVPKSDKEVMALVTSLIGLRGNAGNFVTTYYPYKDILYMPRRNFATAYPEAGRFLDRPTSPISSNYGPPNKGRNPFEAVEKYWEKNLASNSLLFLSESWRKTGYHHGQVNLAKIFETVRASAPQQEGIAGFGSPAGVDGESISGYGKDRKALTINFNAPIVEWESTINTDDPNEVVQEVSASIESAASRAIQIALLGATGKMNQRF